VLNDVLFRPQDTSAETATLWLYCSPKLVVTARFKPLRFIEWMLPRLQTLRVNTSTELLAFLLEEQEEVLEQVVRQASRHVDLIEERLLSNHVQRNRADLARLRRMLLFSGCWRRSRRRCSGCLTGRRRGWIARWCRRFVSSPKSLAWCLTTCPA
jgi:zinc transporter